MNKMNLILGHNGVTGAPSNGNIHLFYWEVKS